MIFAAKRIVRSACCFLPRSQIARASLLSNCVAKTSFKYVLMFLHNAIFTKPPPFVGVPHPCQLTAVKCQPNVGKLHAFFPHCQDNKPKSILLSKHHWTYSHCQIERHWVIRCLVLVQAILERHQCIFIPSQSNQGNPNVVENFGAHSLMNLLRIH